MENSIENDISYLQLHDPLDYLAKHLCFFVLLCYDQVLIDTHHNYLHILYQDYQVLQPYVHFLLQLKIPNPFLQFHQNLLCEELFVYCYLAELQVYCKENYYQLLLYNIVLLADSCMWTSLMQHRY